MERESQQPQVVVVPPGDQRGEQERAPDVEHPAKVMRIASMCRSLLDELRAAPLDEASRARLADIHDMSVKELAEVLSPELRAELDRLSSPFEQEAPSDAELRVAHAQLVGWLEGLFHGIQAMLFAQQMENQARLQEMRRRGLPGPAEGPSQEGRPGTYL